MKIIKPFNSYIAENFETPGEAPVNISSAQSRMGDTRFIDPKEELKTQLDTINSKLSENQYFLVEEDLGGEYASRGVYNDLNIFVDELKDIIIEREFISNTEIEFEVDELSDADYILVRYGHSEDMFKYTIVTLNEYFDDDI
jgi:hypothetical protein